MLVFAVKGFWVSGWVVHNIAKNTFISTIVHDTHAFTVPRLFLGLDIWLCSANELV